MKDGKSDEAVKFIHKLTQHVEYTGDYVRTNNFVHKYDGLMMCQEDNNFIWTIGFDENAG